MPHLGHPRGKFGGIDLTPCREKTGICDGGGECLLCDAINGQKCKEPNWIPSHEFLQELRSLKEQVDYICPCCGHDKRND